MSIKLKTTEVHYSYFDEIYHTSDGGVLNLNQVRLILSHCIFRKCNVSEESNGGAIHLLTNNCNCSCIFNCETDCYAKNGYFMYYVLWEMFMFIDGNSLSLSSCKEKGGFYCDNSSTILRNVNFSNNKPGYHGSFLSTRSYYVNSKYNIFHKNADDVLFYYGSLIDFGTIISCSLFVDNTYSQQRHGYIHINQNNNQNAYAINLTFINNKHFFFAPTKGYNNCKKYIL